MPVRRILIAISFVLCLVALAAPSFAAAKRGKLYVIGLGPAGPQTATLQALTTIKRMDALLCHPRHRKPFAKYIGQTPVWFDHLSGLWDYKGRFFTQLGPKELAEFQKERERLTKERLARIEAFLAKGKNLGMMEGGNPCVFSSSHWYTERMDPKDLVYIAGMGSDAAAMSALKASVIPAHQARFLLQSAPFVITDDFHEFQVLEKLAPYRPTMIFYMALRNPKPFFTALGKAFGANTPCAVVYWAGWPDKELVVRGSLADMPAKMTKQSERYLGLLLVGDFLKPKPYLGSHP
jgi:precorrin-4 methylase